MSPDDGRNAPASFLTAEAIFKMLFDRGFDHWWGGIDEDTQIEITDELNKIVMKYA